MAPGKFITFFYAVVNSAGMRIDYCNAGQNPPMLQHRDATLESLGEGGPVLGYCLARVMPTGWRNSDRAIVW